jgi:hypothetical protein
MALTVRNEKFAQEYILNNGNASAAYRTAYPASLKWKDNTVHSRASELLKKGEVLGRIKELRAEVKEKFDISTERLLLEQSRLAYQDYRKIFDKNGHLLPHDKMPDEIASAISSVKISRVNRQDGIEESVIELKFWNKNTAIDSLMKHKGLYEQDNSQKRPMVIVKDFAGGDNE